MTGQLVLTETRVGVGVVTLNRPDRGNAWSGPLEDEYLDALRQLEADPDVRAIVVTGAGRSYCVGADSGGLDAMGKSGKNTREGAGQARAVRATITTRKPVIAAVNGGCAGVGLAQAMSCDVRFAAEGAKLTTAYARRGLAAEDGTSWLLPRLVGLARAQELLLSGRVFLAEEAAAVGLVHRVLPAAELLGAAVAYAADLAASCSPTAMAGIKEQLWRTYSTDLDATIADAWRRTQAALASEDFREGIASFVDKRPPRFPPLGPPEVAG